MLNFSSIELMLIIGKIWWPFFRIISALWLLPIFGDTRITPSVRILFALTLAILISPVVPVVDNINPFSLGSIILALEQILFGLFFGLSLTMLFTMMKLIGEILSMQMGLSMAVMNDPSSGGSSHVNSHLLTIFATLLFLSFNGHLIVLDILVESFVTWPIGSSIYLLNIDIILKLVSWMFMAALMLAMPAIVAMLLVNITFGVMNRSAPSLNVYSLGFPMGMLLGIICLGLVFRVIPNRFFDFTVFILEQMRFISGGLNV
ncbi:putative flagellar biosynthetic protein FliR [Moritella sp. PE36]|uniref:flagellar biosynthetic protein FliR n=1 Tax=Moritella sp. PE36 TaxID=58051 RepID=UPI000156820F|nr:flagellar biosynthetic protein FliR [Moritella sp. PE36]EDM67995.1 putative flagellar biosynthetic protein FliR [Moritella sp. PE36]